MVANKQCVMGMSLGTQKIGIVVLQNNLPIVHKVAAFNGRWNEQKLHTILRSIASVRVRNHVTAVSIKIPRPSHHTAGLKALIGAIKEKYKAANIPLHICTIKELKAHGITEGRKNRKQLVQAMAIKYPDLYTKAVKSQQSPIAYHTKMFEAVAAAELLQNRTIK